MKSALLPSCLALFSLVSPLVAQGDRPDRELPRPPERGERQQGERGPRGPEQFLSNLPVVKALDANGDRILSGEEIKDATRKLSALDTSKDGKLSGEEVLPPPPEDRDAPGEGEGRAPGGREGGAPPRGPGGTGFLMRLPVMSTLDRDADGEISAKELQEATASLQRLDKDQDGEIEMFEMIPERPPGRRGSRRGRGFGPADPNVKRQAPEEVEFRNGAASLPDRGTFEKLSYQGEEILIDTHLIGNQFVKFQIEEAASENPQLYFINTKTHRAHMRFMSAVGIQRVRSDPGSQMRGVLVYRPLARGPDGKPGLYTFEFEPHDRYPFAAIKIAYELLVAKGDELKGQLGYYPMPSALPRYREEKKLYDAAAFRVYLDEDLFRDIGYLPLNPGESYGRLRVMGLDEHPRPRDIVLYKSLPNEMPRSAGIITAVRQTPLSHVNLRAIQDKVPNAFITRAAEQEKIAALVGKYVYYKVEASGYTLREATDEEVEAHFAELRPAEPRKPKRDLAVTGIRPLSEVGFEDSDNVGVKASNLATMGSFELAEGMVPKGFAVPFHFYHAFMEHNGFYEKAGGILGDEELGKDSEALQKALKDFRKLIRSGDFPDEMRKSLEVVHASFPEGTSLRCRSSTNNEDLPGFSGAGLYDSCTHRPDEGHLSKSIKQVFASLWNFRAVQEREFYRIDHLTTAMGVLIHPNFDDEEANGVAVTSDILYQTEGTYYVNTQVGEDLVTNPEEESVPEELLLDWFDVREVKVMRRSNRTSRDRILEPEHLEQLRKSLGIIHNRFAKLYGHTYEARDFAMEVEFKITREGKLSIKQARPWVFAE
ncbi:MAG TPA: PEP/pyruvate-binding domain-containing protein [Roseibacillus sp.]|nr:PEP/pyruvate-binding domain-containing protein [Roseibacillus sp.]